MEGVGGKGTPHILESARVEKGCEPRGRVTGRKKHFVHDRGQGFYSKKVNEEKKGYWGKGGKRGSKLSGGGHAGKGVRLGKGGKTGSE